eukprot:COSAG06_NODE_2820_length_6233_cov_12.699463_6_plen_459_part_00
MEVQQRDGGEDDEPTPLLGDGIASAETAAHAQPRSPHNRKMKALFGLSSLSPWCAIIGMGVSGEILALKYRADVGVISTIKLVQGVLTLLFDVLIGYLQDKEMWLFGQYGFSKERWGRRAPWLIVHSPVMAVAMYLSWTPPDIGSPDSLALWYFVTMFVGTWCWEVIMVAVQAGIVECYPYKEERVQVEAFSVLFAAIGVSFAVVLIAVAYQFPLEEQPAVRTGLGLVCGGIGLLSLPSAFALRDARQPANAARISLLASIREVWGNHAWRWYALASVLDGLAGGVQAGFFLYYYTFVAALSDQQIAVWIVVVPVLGLTIQAAMAQFWGCWFANQARTPMAITVGGRLLDAVASFAIFAAGSSIEYFLLAYCVNRVLLSPRSFWAVSARGWVIDEDAHLVTGRRRESLFTGVSSAIAKLASPAAAAFLAGQSLAGIDTTQKDRNFQQPASGILCESQL